MARKPIPPHGDKIDLALAEPTHAAFQALSYLLLLVVSLLLQNRGVINHDVAWLVTAAQKWLGGASYGSEIVEINTPGAMLLYVPAAWMIKLTDCGARLAVDLWFDLVAFAFAALTGRIAAMLAGMPANSRHAFVSAFLVYFTFTLYPTSDLAQRDHFIALAMLPYALVALNRQQIEFDRFCRLGAAVGIALALCIKPQYLLIVFVIFVYELVAGSSRGSWSQVLWKTLFQVDTLLIMMIGVSYLIVVAAFFPEWLKMVWTLGPVFVYEISSWDTLGRCSVSMITLFAAATALFFPLPGKRYLISCFVPASATLGQVILEGKPWPYHQLPILLLLSTGAVLCFVSWLPTLMRSARHPLAAGAVTALIPIFLALNSVEVMAGARYMKEALPISQTLKTIARQGDRIIFLSDALYPAVTVVSDGGFNWALRYPCLWPLAGAVTLQNAGKLDAASADKIIDDVAQGIAADITSAHPAIIAVDHKRDMLVLPPNTQILPLLLRNSAFAAAMQDYHQQGGDADFIIFIRNAEDVAASQSPRK